jgi:long-subunit fatty acid transport protein
LADAVVNPVTGDLSKGRGWSIAGGLHHYWTPQVRQALVGSYARFDYSAGTATARLVDFKEWRLGTNLVWQPVNELNLGAEVMYVHLDPRGRLIVPTGESISSDSAWEGRLQLQRDF